MNDLPTHCPACGTPVNMATAQTCLELRGPFGNYENAVCGLPVCPSCGVRLGECDEVGCPHAPDA